MHWPRESCHFDNDKHCPALFQFMASVRRKLLDINYSNAWWPTSTASAPGYVAVKNHVLVRG